MKTFFLILGLNLSIVSLPVQSVAEQSVSEETTVWLEAEICIRLAARYLHSEEDLSTEESVGRAASECSDKIDLMILSALQSEAVQSARESEGIAFERAARMMFDNQVFRMKLRVLDELEEGSQ
ncbi:hypothetical protein CEP88_19005 [Roseobacter denitrificans]|uniref:hypothetical protein n=1 Tax=Roseobacter denitrificans TaxID=2434 RepID=UPI0005C61FCD|nr:hypothetical protein [Roseobacter denitrificans]AVL54469.1 hypothetical protein CEP88_19005 [Roseobacter denitrificans]SFG51146.1 hypothetical protein SAMN05443635_1292 [Roseobacter denitrificans OCh 114]